MPSVEFLCPRLIGARFEDGEIPLEFLRDLAALRKLVLDVAKWRFLAANPERARIYGQSSVEAYGSPQRKRYGYYRSFR